MLPDARSGDGRGLPLQYQTELVDFVRDQYRHGKPLLMLGDAAELLRAAGVPEALLDGDPRLGLFRCERPQDPALLVDAETVNAFIASLGRPRFLAREGGLA